MLMTSQIQVNNNIYGLNTIAHKKYFDINANSQRIATSTKLFGDDIVSRVIGNGISDNSHYYKGLIKSVGNGISLLQSAQVGLECIHSLLVDQQSLLEVASGQDLEKLLVLNAKFKANEKKISTVVERTIFGNTKLLNGTFGIDRARDIRYPHEVNSVSIATKSAPIGPTVFLRDNMAFQPFESSAASVVLNNISDNDFILIEDYKFTFRKNPNLSLQNEIQIQPTDEENARRLVTSILNSDHMRLKRYAATYTAGGALMVQSHIRSGEAVRIFSSSPSITIDNELPRSDDNVLDLDKLTDNENFTGHVSPNFMLDASPRYGVDARNLAIINGIDLSSYIGDVGDSAAKYNCTIGTKNYTGVIFLRGNAGAIQAMNTAPAGPEKLFLIMREVDNTSSSFTINFEPTYTGILNNHNNANVIAHKLNDLFARMTFKQNRYIAVNESPDTKFGKFFDTTTATATITNTNFEDLEIENIDINKNSLNSNLVEFKMTINGAEYSDTTVKKTLQEGDRISMKFDDINFVSVTIGKGGLNLNNEQDYESIRQAMLTFFTNQERYHEVPVTKDRLNGVTTKIEDCSINALFAGKDGEYKELSILNKLDRRRSSIALMNAVNQVKLQIATIQSSIETILVEMDRINDLINLSDKLYQSLTNIDLVQVAGEFISNVDELQSLIAVEAAMRIIDAGAQQIVSGIASSSSSNDNKSNQRQESKAESKSQAKSAAPAA